MKGMRKVQLYIPIVTHERIKVIAQEAGNMTHGKAANILLLLGIQKFDEQVKEATQEANKEPADIASGD